MEPTLDVQSLRAGYRDRDVLRDVSWKVAPGELWAILGPNGAGKSTLVRACLGLLPARAGQVVIGGAPLAQWRRDALARFTAWVPQNTEALTGFTGLELVLMGRSPHLGRWGLPSQPDVARATEALQELGALAFAHRPVERLSGGERRLLYFARALAQAPRLLFLDEPTAFLDLRHQVESLECLRRRAKEGMAVVAILHDVNLAAAFADKILLLKDGEVAAAGPAAEVLDAPALERLYGVGITGAHSGSQALFAPRSAR